MNIPISLRIFKCPGASPNVTVEYPENCEYPENIWDIKFESLNILKDIEVGYTENPEYPEKYSVKYSVLSPNINILVNIQKTSSSDIRRDTFTKDCCRHVLMFYIFFINLSWKSGTYVRILVIFSGSLGSSYFLLPGLVLIPSLFIKKNEIL